MYKYVKINRFLTIKVLCYLDFFNIVIWLESLRHRFKVLVDVCLCHRYVKLSWKPIYITDRRYLHGIHTIVVNSRLDELQNDSKNRDSPNNDKLDDSDDFTRFLFVKDGSGDCGGCAICNGMYDDSMVCEVFCAKFLIRFECNDEVFIVLILCEDGE